MNIFTYLRRCSWYFSGLLVLLVIAVSMLLLCGKSHSFIYLNSYHPFFLNVFFINYTFIGDGIFALCLIAFFLFYFKRKRIGFTLLASFLISGIAAQVLKNIYNAPRPRLFFEAGQYLYFIDGVSLSNNASFPSGHTATAFAIATVIAMLITNKTHQLFLLVAAALVGYSRIYLAQHFLLDVMIGAVIGSLSGVLSLYLVMNIKPIIIAMRKLRGTSAEETLPATPSVQAI